MTSIIICFHERLPHLKHCLDSLRFSRDDFDEVVISDDGSSAETVQALRELIATYDFPIRHVWQENQGFRVAAARNNGIRNAAGNYLIFFDCDFLILPGTVREHLNRAKKKRFVAGNCKYLDKQQTETVFKGGVSVEFLEKLYNSLSEKNLLHEHRKFNRRTWLMRLHLISPKKQSLGGHFSIHREDIEHINGYDENFIGWGGEDEDLGVRLVMAGIFCVSAITHTRVLHAWHPREQKSFDWRNGNNIEYFQREHIPIFAKNGLLKK